jgi:hypothetical protein
MPTREETYEWVADRQEEITGRRPDVNAPPPPPLGSAPATSNSGRGSSSRNSRPRTSPELAGAANDLGIDMSALNGGGGYVDPEDPLVWDGSQYVRRSQLISRFYILPESELRRFQESAVRAGILNPQRTRFGAYDDETFSVWQSAVNQSAGFAAHQIKRSPFEALDAIANATPGGFDEDGTTPPSATVAHPDSIRQNLRAAATEILGEKLDDSTMEKLIRKFQSLQQNAQYSQQAAAREGGVSVAAPEFNAFAETEIQRAEPVAYDSRKVVAQFQSLARMLGGE